MNKPLLIKFGDNDFSNTFIPLMKALKESCRDDRKEELVELINRCLHPFYLLYQGWEHSPSGREDLKDYLKITKDQVYYGIEEVTAFMLDQVKMHNCDHDCYYFYPHMDNIGVL